MEVEILRPGPCRLGEDPCGTRDQSLCVLGLPFRRRSSANPEDGWVQHREVSDADRACLDDKLRFFGWKWAGFWAWLDSIGKNTQPVPMSPASDGRPASTSKASFPRK